VNFVRKKQRGQNQKVRRTWLSEEGYRIVWRKEVHGVRVPARFQATVRTIIPNYGGVEGGSFEMWDFTDLAHRLFKARGKAEESCERHRRLWAKACEATSIRQLTEIFGRLPSGYPAWVRKKLSRKEYELLTRPRKAKYQEDEECPETPSLDGAPSPAGPTKTSDSSALPTEAVSGIPIPASPAGDKERSTTPRTRRARSKATSTGEPSAAPPAEAAARGQKKPAAKRARKSSKSAAKRRRSTTDSPAAAKTRSRGSRKTKSKPCGSWVYEHD
jgi:hypothetical protein